MTSCIHLANEYMIAKSTEEPQILTCVAEVFAPNEMTSDTTSYSRRGPVSRATGEQSSLPGVDRYFFLKLAMGSTQSSI